MLIKVGNFFHVSSDYMLGLDGRTYIEITGLSVEVIAHIQQIIHDIKRGQR